MGKGILVGIGVVAAALLPIPAHAGGAATAWAAPTTLSVESLRYRDYEGTISASRFGIGPSATQICIDLTRPTTSADGSTSYDALRGCTRNARLSAYSFDPVRWRAEIHSAVNLAHTRSTFAPDGVFLSSSHSPAGKARIDLHWVGRGNPQITAKSGTSYTLWMLWVDLFASKQARVSGTVAMPDTVLRLANVPGQMMTGVDT